MKKYIYTTGIEQRANAKDKNGKLMFVREVPLETKVNMPHIEAVDMTTALAKLNLTAYAQPVAPVIVPKPRAITKRELVDKLIDLGVATEFNALLGKLPLEEKLRWEASPTIHPEYPFLVDGRAMILAVLGITGEQLDNLFY
jgi:hypothetical protein